MTAPSNRLVHAATVEGLFRRALRDKMTAALEQRLKAVGIDLSKQLAPRYPLQVWHEALEAAAEELLPGVPLPKAVETLGEWTVSGYFDTFIGKAVKTALKLAGVRRGLERLAQNFSSANNFMRSEVR